MSGEAPPRGEGLTRISDFGGWWAKREDDAGYAGPDYPTGAKVRQFMRMAAAHPGAPMLVGCSAESAMQVYIAGAAKVAGVRGIVYVSARARRTAATEYAIAMGAEVHEVRPGYLSVCRARARAAAKELGTVVRWDAALAVLDSAEQVLNLPAGVRRIVVPVGTGAIAAGLLVGLARADRTDVEVFGVAVSHMAGEGGVLASARKVCGADAVLPPLRIVGPFSRYDAPAFAALPDGTELDPYYAAKVLPCVRPGDCLWISGARPLSAWPARRGVASRGGRRA